MADLGLDADAAELEQLAERYRAAVHGMQSGVAALNSDECSPKHLRVGVNAAMVEHGALVELLIQKGLITRLEFMRSLVKFMEAEKADYEKKLSQKFGADVRLG